MTGGVYSGTEATLVITACRASPHPSQVKVTVVPGCARATTGSGTKKRSFTASGGRSDTTGWPAFTHSPDLEEHVLDPRRSRRTRLKVAQLVARGGDGRLRFRHMGTGRFDFLVPGRKRCNIGRGIGLGHPHLEARDVRFGRVQARLCGCARVGQRARSHKLLAGQYQVRFGLAPSELRSPQVRARACR